MTFQKIMKYTPENISVFQEMQKNIARIIPFVGAGLSIDYGYPLWGKFLMDLNEMLHSPSEAVSRQIEEGAYIEASAELERKLTLRRIYRKMAETFSVDRMKRKKGTAAAILPYLFPDGPVITTNYDQVLETLYMDCRRNFCKTLLPYNRSMADGANQRELHMLLKLHGEACADAVDDQSIVFTKSQYEKAYAADTDVVRALNQFAASHILLFLGCSLADDETVTLLSEFSSDNRFHYAILPCAETQIDERLAQLAEGPNVRAILYPKGEHEAVQVILDELLRRVKPEEYEKLQSVEPKFPKDPNRFVYHAENIDFYGRQEEWKALEDFSEDPRSILWWTVSGAGGSGKSRLAYEFRKAQSDCGWATVSLRQREYDQLADKYGCGWMTQDTLFVADYVQGHMEQIGSWISGLEQDRTCLPGKVRILLLERDGTCAEDSPWLCGLKDSVSRSDLFRNDCYDRQWLHLEPMSEDLLKEIMADFCRSVRNHPLSETDQNAVYTALQEVDPTLRRPLFALFVADAYIEHHAPRKWDPDTTMDWIYHGECRLIRESLRDCGGVTDQTDAEDLLKLYAAATVYGELSLDKLKAVCPTVWKNFLDTVPGKREDRVRRLLKQIGLLDSGGMLRPIEPDLLGEYFVLRQVVETELRCDSVNRELVGNFHNANVVLFIDYSLNDYPEMVKKLNWIVDKIYETKFSEAEWDTYVPIMHSMLLVDLILIQTVDEYKETVSHLRDIYMKKRSVPKIIQSYSNALFNLCHDQTGRDSINTSDLLCNLCNENPTNLDVAEDYAKSLIKLAVVSSPKMAPEIFERSRLLYILYPRAEYIAEALSVSGAISAESRPELKKKLKNLVTQFRRDYPANRNIQIAEQRLLDL